MRFNIQLLFNCSKKVSRMGNSELYGVGSIRQQDVYMVDNSRKCPSFDASMPIHLGSIVFSIHCKEPGYDKTRSVVALDQILSIVKKKERERVK